jgi:hypothetical protein
MLGDGLVSWLDIGAKPSREKDLIQIKKRNGKKKKRNVHMK